MASFLTDVSILPNACIKLTAMKIFGRHMPQAVPYCQSHLIQFVDAEIDLIISLLKHLPADFQTCMYDMRREDHVTLYSLIILRLCQQSHNLSNGIQLADGVYVFTEQAMSDLGLNVTSRKVIRILIASLRRSRLHRSEFLCLFYLLALDKRLAENRHEFDVRYLCLLRLLQTYLERHIRERSVREERIKLILTIKETVELFGWYFFDNVVRLRKRIDSRLRTFG
ncbi:unnamed protein product [Acanthosepion pharaonis]|uniref:Uncharacterized protein n=1 Tax=Acanthosepion pharaonis TaxID=158019 RepID=A0A812EK36_ACAPH|nr:unnamed protein product [Sepia pharaonis]